MSNKYTEYFKNNPKGYWFKRKLYGWGWTPVKWQGWLVIALYIAGAFYIFKDIGKEVYSTNQVLIRFIMPIIIWTGILIYICFKKGQKPKWQWGKELED